MRISLGDLLLVRGDDAEALAQLREGLEIIRRAQGPRNQAVGWALCAVAVATARQGDLGRALEVMVEARDITVEALGPEHPAAVARCVDLAHLVARQGDLERAVEICREARAPHAPRASDSGVARRLHAQVSGPLGSFLRRLGRLDEAERELRSALSTLEQQQGAEHGDLAFHHEQLALLYEERGDLERAIASAERARAIAEGHRTRLLGSELDRAYYAGAMRLGSRTRLAARLHLRAGQVARAFDLSEAGRGRAMLDLLSRSERELAAGGDEELQRRIEAEERARFDARAAEAAWTATGCADDGRRRVLVQARAALDRAATEVNAFLRGTWTDARPLDIETVRERLAPGERILAYHWSERMVAVFVVPGGPSGEPWAEVLAEGASVSGLHSRVERLCRRLVQDPRHRGEPIDAGELAELAEGLLPERVRRSLGEAQRVVVLPDGPLVELPLELLWRPEAGRPDLVQAPSATVYLNRMQVARDRGEPRGHVLVLGDPAFPQDEGAARARFGALPRLPATRVEAELVAGMFGEGGARIVHLATHGRHGTADHPYDAALALADEHRGPEAFLTLDRLIGAWRGRLLACDLVVLSACDTNRRVQAGTSSISLPWGFFYAGAPTVIASLWQVDESATALLMGRFYSNLTGRHDAPREVGASVFEPGQPMTKIQALREAKTWLRRATRRELRSASAAMGLGSASGGIRSPTPQASESGTSVSASELVPYADPYFWSAFVLVGSPD
jgi:CHAT domain-containing protein